MNRTGKTAGARRVRERRENEAEFDRIAAFTDGVLAIAITLLVLNVEVPRVPEGELGRGLVDLLPDLGAYALSFAVIARYWIVHHRFFGSLARFDNWLVTRNLLYLALIVLVPFTSELLGEYGNIAIAAIVYAGVLGAAALVSWLMIHHAVAYDMVKPEELSGTQEFSDRGALFLPGIFFASMPVALISPTAAEIMWAGIVVVHQRRGAGRRAA